MQTVEQYLQSFKHVVCLMPRRTNYNIPNRVDIYCNVYTDGGSSIHMDMFKPHAAKMTGALLVCPLFDIKAHIPTILSTYPELTIVFDNSSLDTVTINTQTPRIVKITNRLDHFKHYTDKAAIARIKFVLFKLMDLLDEHKITYFADGGTLLGAHRHGGIIPWDIDADIGVLASDESRIHALLSSIPGWIVKRNVLDTHWKIYHKESGDGLVDLFCYDSEGVPTDYRFSSPHTVDVNANYRGMRIFPLQYKKFYDRMIPVACDYLTVLGNITNIGEARVSMNTVIDVGFEPA